MPFVRKRVKFNLPARELRDPRYKDEKFYGIPYPAVYVIGDRKIVWAKIEKDYKNHPTNAEIRAEIDKLKVK